MEQMEDFEPDPQHRTGEQNGGSAETMKKSTRVGQEEEGTGLQDIGKAGLEELSVFGPDDPGFMEEFGEKRDGTESQQELFDWFALETDEPIEMDGNIPGEPTHLSDTLAEMSHERRHDGTRSPDKLSRPDPEVFRRADSGAARIDEFGLDRGRGPDEPVGAIENQRQQKGHQGQTDAGSRVAGEPPEAAAANDPGIGHEGNSPGGIVTWGRKFSSANRRLAVFCAALVSGLVILLSTGDGGLKIMAREILSSIAQSTGIGASGIDAANSRDASEILPQLPEARPPGFRAGEVAAFPAEIGQDASPNTPAGVSNGSAMDWRSGVDDQRETLIRLVLEPVNGSAGIPVPIDPAEMEQWNRLFDLLEQPTGTLTLQTATTEQRVADTEKHDPETSAGSNHEVPETIAAQPAMPMAILPSSSGPQATGFGTADDGFIDAGLNEAASTRVAGQSIEFLGPDLPVQESATESGSPPVAIVEPTTGTAQATGTASIDSEQDFVPGLAAVEERLTAIEELLVQLLGKEPVEAGQGSKDALLQLPLGGPLSSSKIDAQVPFGVAEDEYVITTASGRPSLAASFEGIAVGDHVQGFGVVLEVTEYGGSGRLYVMERGSVYLN